MTDTLLKGMTYLPTPTEVDLAALPDALLIGDWKAAAVSRGWGWHVTIGDLSTPILGGGAGTTLAAQQPECVVDVPLGWTIRPLRIAIDCETPLTASDLDEVESLIAFDRAAVSGATASNGTVEAPINMRTDVIAGCPCTVVSAVVTNITAPTLGVELSRKVIVADLVGTQANALWGSHAHLYEPKHPPFIVGPAALYLYWGGTVATSGYANLDFIAFPSAKITSLV